MKIAKLMREEYAVTGSRVWIRALLHVELVECNWFLPLLVICMGISNFHLGKDFDVLLNARESVHFYFAFVYVTPELMHKFKKLFRGCC